MKKVLTKADLILTTNKLHLLHESNENIRKNRAFNTIKIEQTSNLNLKREIKAKTNRSTLLDLENAETES